MLEATSYSITFLSFPTEKSLNLTSSFSSRLSPNAIDVISISWDFILLKYTHSYALYGSFLYTVTPWAVSLHAKNLPSLLTIIYVICTNFFSVAYKFSLNFLNYPVLVSSTKITARCAINNSSPSGVNVIVVNICYLESLSLESSFLKYS